MNKLLFGLAAVLLLLGIGFAIGNVDGVHSTSYARWYQDTSQNFTTEGGNITNVNVTATSLTDKWADVFGNVSGNLTLKSNGDTTKYAYLWSWNPATGGEVCMGTDASFDWSSVQNATAADIDTAWGFGSAADNATNTYTDNNTNVCAFDFSQRSGITSSDGADIGSDSSYESCVLGDVASPGSKGNLVFCTHINNTGTNYNGTAYNYELLLPTNASSSTATETYYVFAELN